MKFAGVVESDKVVSIDLIRAEVRESQVQVGVYIMDLDAERVGIITENKPEVKQFTVSFIDNGDTNTYSSDFDNYRLATEDEVTIEYYRKSLVENNTPVKQLVDKKYIFIHDINAVGKIISVVNAEKVLYKKLFKLKEREQITAETDMTGYFLRTGVLEVSDSNWREATEEEIAFFKKKVDEMHHITFSRLQNSPKL